MAHHERDAVSHELHSHDSPEHHQRRVVRSRPNESGRYAIASHTLVPHETKLEPEAWKKLMNDHGFDTLILCRLVDMQVKEKDMGAKVNLPTMGTGYSYYSHTYAQVYQPASYVREQTALLETRVFDVATEKEVWSAQSKTEIAWGGDPEAQVKKFVALLAKAAKK